VFAGILTGGQFNAHKHGINTLLEWSGAINTLAHWP